MLKLYVIYETCPIWVVFLARIAEPSLPMNPGFVIKPISPGAEYFTFLNTTTKCANEGLDISQDVGPGDVN